MKKRAKITRIENGIIYALSENPFGESPERGWFPNDGRHGTLDQYRERWHQAESELKELPLDTFVRFNGSPDFMKAFIGQEIDVIEVDNKFKIV